MKVLYRILDYQNGEIISDISCTVWVGVMLKVISQYSNSWDVVTHNNEFITSDFVEQSPGTWIYSPQDRQAEA